jgi:hypothetical protein
VPLQDSSTIKPFFRTCEHSWIYYVDVASRAIYDRRCKECGRRELLNGL